jgi:hypothetical protein
MQNQRQSRQASLLILINLVTSLRCGGKLSSNTVKECESAHTDQGSVGILWESILSPMIEDRGDMCRAKKSTTINQSPWNVAPGKELDSWFSMVVRHILVVINLRCMVDSLDKIGLKDAYTFIQ